MRTNCPFCNQSAGKEVNTVSSVTDYDYEDYDDADDADGDEDDEDDYEADLEDGEIVCPGCNGVDVEPTGEKAEEWECLECGYKFRVKF